MSDGWEPLTGWGGEGGANGKNFTRGQKNSLEGHHGPYFLLAGQMYLFTINCQSLAEFQTFRGRGPPP